MEMQPEPVTYLKDSSIILVNETQIELDPVLNKLLSYFIANPQRIVTREELVSEVWGDVHVSNDALNRAISILRKSLGGERERFIKTVHRKGYRFINSDALIVSDSIANEMQGKKHKRDGRLQQSAALQVNDVNFPLIRRLFIFRAQFNRSLFFVILVLIMPLTWLIYNFLLTEKIPKKSEDPTVVAIFPFELTSNIDVAPDQIQRAERLALSQVNLLSAIVALDKTNRSKKVSEETFSTPTNTKSLLTYISKRNEDITIELKLFGQDDKLILDHVFELGQQKDFASAVAEEVKSLLKIKYEFYKNNRKFTLIDNMPPSSHVTLLSAYQYYLSKTPNSINKAIEIMEGLVSKYPSIDKFKGVLLIYQAAKTPMSIREKSEIEKYIAQAEELLLTDPINQEALTFLTNAYRAMVDRRNSAFSNSDMALNNYPTIPIMWQNHLYLLTLSKRPCSEIADHLQFGIDNKVVRRYQFETISLLLDVCQNNGNMNEIIEAWNGEVDSLAAKLSQDHGMSISSAKEYLQRAFTGYIRLFSLRVDQRLASSKRIYEKKATNSSRISWAYKQLLLKNHAAAKLISLEIDGDNSHHWHNILSIYSELHDANIYDQYTSNSRLTKLYIPDLLPYITALLIKRDAPEADFVEFSELFPDFAVNVINAKESISYIVSLYFAGDKERSARLAQALYNKISTYKKNYPESYKFWALGQFKLISGFYCGSLCPDFNEQKKSFFANEFSKEERWWLFDQSLNGQLLRPWKKDPLVQQFMALIDQDIKRVKRDIHI
ncbi:MAG: winged helix-turn-helix domain-containing protein [Gammaproteobacteria bacterium]|nr:winged helix-turn-helix domain-containing protein [Gammaproteobacteria bacterium]